MRLNKFKRPESASNSVESSNFSDRSNSDDVMRSPKSEVKKKTSREGSRTRRLRKEKKKKKIGKQEKKESKKKKSQQKASINKQLVGRYIAIKYNKPHHTTLNNTASYGTAQQ